MYRLADFQLEAGTLFAAVLALAYMVQIALSWLLPMEWFWGGALASFAAPLALAATRYLPVRTSSPLRTAEVPHA
jgi:hypothetical protein